MTDAIAADYGIRQLHARFVNAVWRQDAAEFADCFAADGVWKIAGMRLTGSAEIADACHRLLGRCDRIQLIAQQPILEVDGDTAIGRQHMIELAKMPDGAGFMTIGIYYDRYLAGADRRWRFRSRHWSMQYRGATPLDGTWVDSPDYGAFPGMPDDDEPTYVRPAS